MTLKLFLKAQVFALIFFLIFLLVTGLISLGIFYYQFGRFSKESGLSLGESIQIIKTGLSQDARSQDGKLNFLVLGLDSLKTRGDAPPLTDTMMMVSFDLNKAKVSTLSFPRDLWHEDYQTRINALYFYGQERYVGQPERFPVEVMSELTGVKIQYPIVVSFEQVSQLIDLLGGVEVEVPVAFVDESFPRTDVDVTVVRDPLLLYKRVEFAQGKQVMSGEKALEYMRSRKSGDDEGTDVARGGRQQLVLDALLAKLRQKDTLTNPVLLGKLYRYYQDNFSKIISPTQLVAVGKKIWPVRNDFTITNQTISIYPQDENGVIYHPEPRLYRGEWIYILRDSEKFKEFVQAKLGISR